MATSDKPNEIYDTEDYCLFAITEIEEALNRVACLEIEVSRLQRLFGTKE